MPSLQPHSHMVHLAPQELVTELNPSKTGLTMENIQESKKEEILGLVSNMLNNTLREDAVRALCDHCENIKNLPKFIWELKHVPMALTMEIIRIEALVVTFSTSPLDTATANYTCNLMRIIRAMCTDQSLHEPLIKSRIILLLMDFVKSPLLDHPIEILRFTAFCTLKTLLINSNFDVVMYLMDNDLITSCLRTLIDGTELTKLPALCVLYHVLSLTRTIEIIGHNSNKLRDLTNILLETIKTPKVHELTFLRLLIGCLLRLSENPISCRVLLTTKHNQLQQPILQFKASEDPFTFKMFNSLLNNLHRMGDLLIQSNSNMTTDKGELLEQMIAQVSHEYLDSIQTQQFRNHPMYRARPT